MLCGSADVAVGVCMDSGLSKAGRDLGGTVLCELHLVQQGKECICNAWKRVII